MNEKKDVPDPHTNLTMAISSLLSGQQIVMLVLIEQLVRSHAVEIGPLIAALEKARAEAETAVQHTGNDPKATTLAIRQVLGRLEKLSRDLREQP
jgi:hypothetical protein